MKNVWKDFLNRLGDSTMSTIDALKDIQASKIIPGTTGYNGKEFVVEDNPPPDNVESPNLFLQEFEKVLHGLDPHLFLVWHFTLLSLCN